MRIPIGFLLFGIVVDAAIEFSSEKTPFSLEEIITHKNSNFTCDWISDIEVQYRDVETNDIMVYDAVRNTVEMLVPHSVLKLLDAHSYKLSPDNKFVLIPFNRISVPGLYPKLKLAQYSIYSIEEGLYFDLANGEHLRHAEWMPKCDSVIYVKDNNIYYVENFERPEETVAITMDGVPGVIYNGVSDWAYQEEIFNGKFVTMAFSRNGEQLLYLKIDNSDVNEAKFVSYGEPGAIDDQYATEIRMRVSKPGTPIPRYTLWHYNFTDRTTKLVSENEKGREIMSGFKWVNRNKIQISYRNRAQNVSETEICELRINQCRTVHVDRNRRGWAIFDVPIFSRRKDQFVVRKRQGFGTKEYFHLKLVTIDGPEVILTSGPYTVLYAFDWDEENGIVYFQATEPNQPWTEQTYAVDVNGWTKPICVTCDVISPEGTPCKYGSIKLNKKFKYFISTCSGPAPTVVSVYENKIPLSEPRIILERSKELRELSKHRKYPNVLDLKIPVTRTVEADVRLLLPPELKESEDKTYPMLVFVYGGPNSNQLQDRHKFDWSLYLTTNRSIIYAMIDARGSGRKSTEITYAVYKVLGTVEVQDQLTAAKHLSNHLGFVDKSRIGIWGWSYGGYATAKVLEMDEEGVFKCGASVAPVTDWMYYNSFYTERYMGQPSENQQGYRRGSLLYNVTNLRNKKYILIHGTGDENVLYQNAMQFVRVLQRKNVLFEQQTYPDGNHGIENARAHVFRVLDRFWMNCFYQ